MENILNKTCEKCHKIIPDSYNNLLCDDCYRKLEEENKQSGKKCEKCGTDIPSYFVNLLCVPCYRKLEEEQKNNPPQPEIDLNEADDIGDKEPQQQEALPISTISDQKNISAEYNWVGRVAKRFNDIGIIIPPLQRKLYTDIMNEWVNGRTVLDLGCSLGIGSNILSHRARFVKGYDINAESISFATQAFERPNMDFEVMDIEQQIVRPIGAFEIVVMSEVIEHLQNVPQAIENLKRFFNSKLQTVAFITIPNINNDEVRKRDLSNNLHINHWTPEEFVSLLTPHFGKVHLYDVEKVNTWGPDEIVGVDSKCPLLVAKLEEIK